MQELGKILEELEKYTFSAEVYDDFNGETITNLICLGNVREVLEKHMNDGWISVEKQLPTKEECEKDNNEFLVQTDAGERFSCEYDPLADGYNNPLWCCNVPVVAWQPLPEPYRPERT